MPKFEEHVVYVKWHAVVISCNEMEAYLCRVTKAENGSGDHRYNLEKIAYLLNYARAAIRQLSAQRGNKLL